MDNNKDKAILVTGAAHTLGVRARVALHELPIDDHPTILLPIGSDPTVDQELIEAVEPLGSVLARYRPAVLVAALSDRGVEYACLADSAPPQLNLRHIAKALVVTGASGDEMKQLMDEATVGEVQLS